MRAPHC